ncbi:FlgO family outer membrane protein [Desulfobaculum bizertense]|uniref:FlgO domain-containing protein n=1 Tax=Desulfobaculum bizertense DSM 18034 TaxID=1121442 RepID=A0A1T4W699_9BACT|nr:FlgO family outer membrane protein [Desulfobaculum bizertense]UIJ39024.1 hypothetical protein LWC08_05475 [Desulfobaculum bizertense]SKA72790.1 hypothetical protein SAMN02745702_01699 [Desulfobaculum bizertense DSM 18034]
MNLAKFALASLLCATLGVSSAFAQGSIPSAAQQLSSTLSSQIRTKAGISPRACSVLVTTPVDINNLEQSSPLGRALGEELATTLVDHGFRLKEIRKGRNILLRPKVGELLLTRDINLVDERVQKASLVLAGTYSHTSKNVRFNIRLIDARSSEVLAMASTTVPVTQELAELLGPSVTAYAASQVKPSVRASIITRDECAQAYTNPLYEDSEELPFTK